LLTRVSSLIMAGVSLALLAWLMLPTRNDLPPAASAGSDGSPAVAAERADVSRRVSAERVAVLRTSTTTRLFGQVRSVTGGALSASVCWAASADVRAPKRCTPTDREGRFGVEVPESTKLLMASAAGHLGQTASIQHQSARQEINFSLTPGGATVSGQVLDASGGPVVEALVIARSLANEAGLATVLSDSNGGFALSLPPGPIAIRARADGYSDGVGSALSAPAEQVSLVLIAASSVVGRVIDEATEEPVAGVVVTAVNKNGAEVEPFTVDTDDQGRFRFGELSPGGYELSVSGPRWRSASAWVTVGMGQSAEEVVLTLQPATTLQASLSVAGDACRAGTIRLTGASPTFSNIGPEGMVRIDGLLPGAYEAELGCPPGIPQSESLEIGLDPLTTHWDLKLGLSVRGRVLADTGEPRVNVSVGMEPVDRAGVGAACNTNEAGEFECSGLPPGEYDCRANGLDATSDPVRLSLSESRDGIVLRTHAAGKIEVLVEGVTQASAVPWPVFAKNEDQRPSPAVAKPEGSLFVFENLPLGTYQVYAGGEASTRSAAARSVSLRQSGEVISVTLPAPALAAITGRVTNAQGAPVIDALVRAFISDPVFGGALAAGAAVTTNDEGGFVLESLPRGRYDLRVSDSSGEATVSGVETGASGLSVRLEAYGELSGTVRDASNEFVPTFELSYQREQGEITSISGHQGSWSVPWLPPGTYEISVRSTSGAATERVELAPGGQRTVNLLVDASRAVANLDPFARLEPSSESGQTQKR
jgi:protocatechuate 3,4-dioxygenase beta subunit